MVPWGNVWRLSWYWWCMSVGPLVFGAIDAGRRAGFVWNFKDEASGNAFQGVLGGSLLRVA